MSRGLVGEERGGEKCTETKEGELLLYHYREKNLQLYFLRQNKFFPHYNEFISKEINFTNNSITALLEIVNSAVNVCSAVLKLL